jgi:hypothetical protein
MCRAFCLPGAAARAAANILFFRHAPSGRTAGLIQGRPAGGGGHPRVFVFHRISTAKKRVAPVYDCGGLSTKCLKQ